MFAAFALPFAPAIRHFLARFLTCGLALLAITVILGSGKAGAAELDSLSVSLQSFQTDPLAKNGGVVFGLFIGIMLTAATYLFFIWLIVRERGQIFLLCLLLCLSVYMAVTNRGLVEQVHFAPNIENLLASYSLILSCIFSASFTFYFLELDVNIPWLRIPLVLVGLLLTVMLVYSPMDTDLNLTRFILPALCTVAVVMILGAGLLALQRGISGSLTHIVAFTFFLGGVVADPLYDLGYIVTSGDSHNFTYISFAIAALMFSIVIASQFAARQEEKEKALALSNERFTLATRGSNEGLLDWELRSEAIFFSDQFRKILGARIENSTKGLKVWLRMIYDPDRRTIRKALREFRHTGDINTINLEYRIVMPNTDRRWLHTKAIAVRDPRSKKILRLVGSTTDITARKQSETALRASETRFRSITEAHPVPVLIVSLRNATIQYASPGAEQLLGILQGQLLHEYLDRILPDVSARDDIWAAMTGGQPINLKEVQLDCNDGRKLDAALSARRISYQGEDAMVIGLYDLTERKQAEAKISRQQEALQQSEKMAALGGLLAGVAHELNNPLSVVIGQTTLLMEGSTDAKVITRSEKIYKAADRCARIVKSFLALARRKPPERKPVDVNAVINAALELLGYQIRTGNIIVQLDLAPELSTITGDNDQLTQVITNLVMNAAQAMENWGGQRHLTIRSRHEGDQVIVTVADTGPGIPLDIRSRIFEPFFTTKSGKGGTGVGLSLCLNIIASHGGQMILDDTEGGGATFTLQLPATPNLAALSSGTDSQIISQALPSKMRLLLVDDEIEIAQTLADLLEPEGHFVDIAINGAVALDKIRTTPFDIIVSDLRMPVLDGPGLYDALAHELPSYLDKIIYVTGDTLSPHVHSFLASHPVPVIEKPYRLHDVRQAILDVLQRDSNTNKTMTSTS